MKVGILHFAMNHQHAQAAHPLEAWFIEENSALTRRMDRMNEKYTVMRSSVVRTQNYVLELESRLEALEEVITRLVEREHQIVRDAAVATMEQMILESDWVPDDMQRLLNDIEDMEDVDIDYWFGDEQIEGEEQIEL